MNLIGHHFHAVAHANLIHALQLVTLPHPTSGVMGIAKQENRGLFVGTFTLEILKINAISTILIHQLVLYHLTTTVGYRREKAIIDRRLHQDRKSTRLNSSHAN